MKIDEMEWQQLSPGSYVFGKNVRGIVRHNLADVYWSKDFSTISAITVGWYWTVKIGDVTTSKAAESFIAAIQAAEQFLQEHK